MKQDEPDAQNRLPVVTSTLVVIATIVLSGVLVRIITPRAPRAHACPASAEDSSLFSTTVAGERRTRAGRERLRSYGWVDRKRGIVHIPIEVAMQLYLSQGDSKP